MNQDRRSPAAVRYSDVVSDNLSTVPSDPVPAWWLSQRTRGSVR